MQKETIFFFDINGCGGLTNQALLTRMTHASSYRNQFPKRIFWLSCFRGRKQFSFTTILRKDLATIFSVFFEISYFWNLSHRCTCGQELTVTWDIVASVSALGTYRSSLVGSARLKLLNIFCMNNAQFRVIGFVLVRNWAWPSSCRWTCKSILHIWVRLEQWWN